MCVCVCVCVLCMCVLCMCVCVCVCVRVYVRACVYKCVWGGLIDKNEILACIRDECAWCRVC